MSAETIHSTDHRDLRPYKMAHEGREIFEAWFKELTDAYYEQFGRQGMYVPGVEYLSNFADNLSNRLMDINRFPGRKIPSFQEKTLGQHMGFLATYTSAGSFSPDRTTLTQGSLNEHTNDGINFIVRLPLVLAKEAWECSEETELEPIVAVHEALLNDSYVHCLEEISNTGFDILSSTFSHFSVDRLWRRDKLGANHDDPELITISRAEDGSYQYNLSDWAKKALKAMLKAQNQSWPNRGLNESQLATAGALLKLPEPISSGCPIKDFKPLCQFLSDNLSTPG